MQNDEDEIHLKPAALVGLMLALFASNAYLTFDRTEPDDVRPDPFTGAEGRLLAHRIDNLERRLDAIRSDLNLCLSKMHDPDHH